MVLPLRSAGFSMPESSRTTSCMKPLPPNTATIFTGTPLPRTMIGPSATMPPSGALPAPTCLATSTPPRPTAKLTSRPAAVKWPLPWASWIGPKAGRIGGAGNRYVIFSGVCDDAGALSSPKPNALPPARSQRRDILASRADISPSPVDASRTLAALVGGLSLPLYAMVSFCNTTAQARRGFGGRVSGDVGRGTARIPRRDDALPRRVWKSSHRGSGRELSRPRWRGGLPHRSQRLRQINSAQHRLGSLLAERGRGLRRRRARGRAKRPRRLHAAEGSAAALAHRARERDVRRRDPAPGLAGTPAARARAAGKLASGRIRRSLPAPIVGRHAPTRGARAHARGRPVRAPARRAVLGGRRADPDGAAARAGADARTRRQDRAADHARPARSRHAVGPRAGDEPPAGPRHR